MLKIIGLKIALRVAWWIGRATRDRWAKDIALYDAQKALK